MSSARLDVLVLTHDEELNLPHALGSVKDWVNRIFVVDSGSTDRTAAIAEQMGATFVPHAWEGYARQKNWALENLPWESDWVFILDADEAITGGLRQELIDLCARDSVNVREAGFYINRYFVFMKKRLRHCGYFPSWNLRLFKRGRARYEERLIHEHMVVDGLTGSLKGLLAHEDRRGLEYYIAKHNRYSTLEARTVFLGDDHGGELPARLLGNPLERRRFIRKYVYPHLPLRWVFRFAWMYFLNLGILDGVTGFRFCAFIATHELFTSLKLIELQQQTVISSEGTAAPSASDQPPV